MSVGISEPESAEYYAPHINEYYTPLGGFDIAKSKSIWIALVACETGRGNDIRFYKWKFNGVWKVDHARMSCGYWDWDGIPEKVNILKEKFNIK
jgi:hypothetical protein